MADVTEYRGEEIPDRDPVMDLATQPWGEIDWDVITWSRVGSRTGSDRSSQREIAWRMMSRR